MAVKSKPGKREKNQWGLYIALSLIFTLTVFLFYLTLVNSIKYNLQMIENIWVPMAPYHFDNYARAFQEVWRGGLNSIFVTICVTAGALVLSSLAAYSFARFQFPGKHFFYFLIIAFLMIPGFLTLIPQFMLIKSMGLLNSFACQILPVLATSSVMPVMFFRTSFEDLPAGIIEAAQIEGAGELSIFLRVVMPLSKPMIGTVAVMSALSAWNNYIWPLVSVSDKKIMPVILTLKYIPQNPLEGMGPRLAGYVMASIPLIILFSFATRPFIQGVTSGAVKA